MSAVHRHLRIDLQAAHLKEQHPQFERELEDLSERLGKYLEAQQQDLDAAGAILVLRQAAHEALISFVVASLGEKKPNGLFRERPVKWIELKEDIPDEDPVHLALIAKVDNILTNIDFAYQNLEEKVAEIVPLAERLITEFEHVRDFQRSPFNQGPVSQKMGDDEPPEQM